MQLKRPMLTLAKANDPKRIDYISCDLKYGDQAGMTILTQHSDTAGGPGTLDLVKDVGYNQTQVNHEFDIDNLLESSLTSNNQYGFN